MWKPIMNTPHPAPKETVVDWLRQIMELYKYIHSKQIMHRDFHPGNMLLDKNGKIYMLDFGTAIKLKNGVYNHKVE
jgi:serine/threonine-protein kinase